MKNEVGSFPFFCTYVITCSDSCLKGKLVWRLVLVGVQEGWRFLNTTTDCMLPLATDLSHEWQLLFDFYVVNLLF